MDLDQLLRTISIIKGWQISHSNQLSLACPWAGHACNSAVGKILYTCHVVNIFVQHDVGVLWTACSRGTGLEYAKPRCCASQAAKQADCLGACVCLLCHTPFFHYGLLGLALCNGSKSGVRPLQYLHMSLFHSAREMGALHIVQRLVPSWKSSQGHLLLLPSWEYSQLALSTAYKLATNCPLSNLQNVPISTRKKHGTFAFKAFKHSMLKRVSRWRPETYGWKWRGN